LLVEAKTHLRNDEQADLNKLVLNGEPLGIIKRSGLQNTWAEWDATVLQPGTKIYQHPDHIDIFIAVENGKRTAYMDILERGPAIGSLEQK
jgi:hypothetical protein